MPTGLPQEPIEDTSAKVQKFETGATRSSDEGKYDYEGFLSPLVLRRFAEYMHKHRRQADGQLRDSDNWQKGMPIPRYMKSLWRHFMDLWLHHRGLGYLAEDIIEDTLCAIMFNVMGYLNETMKNGGTVSLSPKDRNIYLSKDRSSSE